MKKPGCQKCRLPITALVAVMMLLFFGCSEGSEIIDAEITGGSVVFTGLTQDGIAGEATTAHITLSFDHSIADLSADDINIDGHIGLGKGILMKSHGKSGEYILRITGIQESVTLTVTVEKQGFIFTPASRDIAVIHVPDANTTLVNFTGLSRDGLEGSATTQNLTLTFSADIPDLSADDIVLHGLDGLLEPTKGALTRTAAGVYNLVVGGIDVPGARLIVAPGKAGFTITPWSQTIQVIYHTTAPGGSVSLVSNSINGPLSYSVGSVLTADTGNLNGTGNITYQWLRNGTAIDGASGSSFTVRVIDYANEISVMVGRRGISFVTSAPVQIISGWRVRTIIDHLPHDSDPNNRNQIFQNMTGLAIDSDDNLYIVGDVAFLGNRIIKINTSTIDMDNLSVPPEAVIFSDGGASSPEPDAFNNPPYLYNPRHIVTRPDSDAVYVHQIWGQRGFSNPRTNFFIGFNQPGVDTPSWTSGPVLQALRTAGHGRFNENAVEGAFTVDADGNVYAMSSYHNHTIIKITPEGNTSILAGGGLGGSTGFRDGIGEEAGFNWTGGMTIGHDGHLYIADGYNDGRIRRIDLDTRQTSTFVGGSWGQRDGFGHDAAFTVINGLTYGNDGNYYVADEVGANIRRIAFEDGRGWMVTTIAGLNGDNRGLVDGFGRALGRFNRAWGIAADSQGRIFVVDGSGPGNNWERQTASVRMIWYDHN